MKFKTPQSINALVLRLLQTPQTIAVSQAVKLQELQEPSFFNWVLSTTKFFHEQSFFHNNFFFIFFIQPIYLYILTITLTIALWVKYPLSYGAKNPWDS